eukprot:382170-Alexandrium_andersonii.AAC.1
MPRRSVTTYSGPQLGQPAAGPRWPLWFLRQASRARCPQVKAHPSPSGIGWRQMAQSPMSGMSSSRDSAAPGVPGEAA